MYGSQVQTLGLVGSYYSRHALDGFQVNSELSIPQGTARPGTPTSPVRILNNCSTSFRLFSRLGKITCGLVDVTFMPLSHLSGFIFHSATLYLVTNLACLRNPDNIDNSIASLVKELKEVCEDNLPMKSVDAPRIALRSAATAPEAEKVNSSMVRKPS